MGAAMRGVLSEVRLRLERLAEASDAMAGGAFDRLRGWRPNLLGAEMARLLYTVGGQSDGGAAYAAALVRLQRALARVKRRRAAVVVQRGARRLFARRAAEAVRLEGVRKMAAIRVVCRLQARFRAVRARFDERDRRAELARARSASPRGGVRAALVALQPVARGAKLAARRLDPPRQLGLLRLVEGHLRRAARRPARRRRAGRRRRGRARGSGGR